MARKKPLLCQKCKQPVSRTDRAYCGPCDRKQVEHDIDLANQVEPKKMTPHGALKIIEWWGR